MTPGPRSASTTRGRSASRSARYAARPDAPDVDIAPRRRDCASMVCMQVKDPISRHPAVFHTMPATAWPSVQRHGLLSTQRLVDLYDVDAAEQDLILGAPRGESRVLRAAGMPTAVIRDQKPMKFLAEKISPGSSLVEFLRAINSRVFFWASEARLARLRRAKEYRAEVQIILHVNTCAPVDRHRSRIRLCRFNSGAVTQKNHPERGHEAWLPIAEYPYDEYRQHYGRAGALAEVTVLDAVPDILELTDRIEYTTG